MTIPLQRTEAAQGNAQWYHGKRDLVDLSKALRGGDLEAARKSFAGLQEHAPVLLPNPVRSALDAALRAGDVGAAHQVFAALAPRTASGSRKAVVVDPPLVASPGQGAATLSPANPGSVIDVLA